MSSHPLIITFAPPSGANQENYWIRLEQTNADGDLATVADAAQVIDAVFEINPCEDETTGGEEATLNADGTYTEAVAEEDFVNVVRGVIDFDACLAAGRYDWTATLAIIRSHNAHAYRLVIEGGTLVQTVLVSEQIATSLVFAGETSKDLEFPIVSGLSPSWAGRVITKSGNVPQVTILGSTVNLSEPATGNLSLQYLTEYDRATITVPGNGETSLQSAEVLAFWRYLVEPTTLSPPDIDATTAGDRLLCDQRGEHPESEQPRCWETVSQYTLCSCGDGEADRHDVEQSVSCPEGASPGDHFMGTRSQLVGYADCGKPAFDDISTAEFYEKTCCEPPAFPLPRCAVQRAVMGGGQGIANGPQYYLDTYGPGTKLVGVSPRSGICGTIEWQQRISPKNCCDDIEPIEVIPEASADTIGLNSSATIRVTPGARPYKWRVNAPYFMSQEITEIPENVLYSPAEVCGNATVQISDQCSHTQWVVYQIQTHASPVKLPDDLVIAPDTDFYLYATFGVGPFLWIVGAGIAMTGQSTDGRTAFFHTSPEFCGTVDITVSDICEGSDTLGVRSTEGSWVIVDQATYDRCSPPGAPFTLASDLGEGQALSNPRNGYMVSTYLLQTQFTTEGCRSDLLDIPNSCAMGTEIITGRLEEACTYNPGGCAGEPIFEAGCCRAHPGSDCNGTVYGYSAWAEIVQELYRWEC